MPDSARIGNFLGAMACAGLMAYALYAQHVLGLKPCPLCIFQRVAVIALGLVFLLAAVHGPGRPGRPAPKPDAAPGADRVPPHPRLLLRKALQRRR